MKIITLNKRQINKRMAAIAVFSLVLFSSSALADLPAKLTLTGKDFVTLKKAGIQLGDIAEITADPSQEEFARGLRSLWIAQSPEPGVIKNISGKEILENLSKNGIDPQKITYTFPEVITVTRTGRQISPDEIQGVVTEYLGRTLGDMEIKRISQVGKLFAEEGALSELSVLSCDNSNTSGTNSAPANPNLYRCKVALRSEAGGIGDIANVSATVALFKEVPVARQEIDRGTQISTNDVMMARMDISSLRGEIESNTATLSGLTTTAPIRQGEPFQKQKLALPKVITAGSKVAMVYKANLFEITASGIALEDGVLDQEISVKNESSKKIVKGHVVEAGLVRVQ